MIDALFMGSAWDEIAAVKQNKVNMEMSERLYPIQGDGYVCNTGKLPDGRQALVGIQMPEIVAVCFDTQGNQVDLIVHEPFGDGKLNEEARRNSELMEIEMKLWERELGLVEDTIFVKRFFIEDRFIGIEDIPSHWKDAIENPDDYTPEDREAFAEERQEWIEEGNFVMYFNEDYFMNNEGEIVSS